MLSFAVSVKIVAPLSPGHEATSPGDAHNLAPRQEAQSSEGELTAKDVALGQEFKKGIK
jgi:hypothetical protein